MAQEWETLKKSSPLGHLHIFAGGEWESFFFLMY